MKPESIKHHDSLILKGKTVIALGTVKNKRITVCPADKIQNIESRMENSFNVNVSKLVKL